jgi:hypothetical protein
MSTPTNHHMTITIHKSPLCYVFVYYVLGALAQLPCGGVLCAAFGSLALCIGRYNTQVPL